MIGRPRRPQGQRPSERHPARSSSTCPQVWPHEQSPGTWSPRQSPQAVRSTNAPRHTTHDSGRYHHWHARVRVVDALAAAVPGAFAAASKPSVTFPAACNAGKAEIWPASKGGNCAARSRRWELGRTGQHDDAIPSAGSINGVVDTYGRQTVAASWSLPLEAVLQAALAASQREP